MARPKALKFQGKNDPNGYYFAGVPARDLDEADIAQLDDETLKTITGGDKPLYVAPKAKAEAKPEPKRAEPKHESKPAEPSKGDAATIEAKA